MLQLQERNMNKLSRADRGRFDSLALVTSTQGARHPGDVHRTRRHSLRRLGRLEQGRQPLLVAADVYRPAAMDQLQTLGQQIEIPVFV